jgi:hypothetical protein
MRGVAIDTRRPNNTKAKGQKPTFCRSEPKRRRIWEYKCSFSRCVMKALDGSVFDVAVIAERNRKTNELRHMAQQVIKEFNGEQGWMEEHRTGRKYEVIKIANGVWKEIEQAIPISFEEQVNKALGGDENNSTVVSINETFF